MTLISNLRGRFGRRRAYLRTLDALRSLPGKTREDCNLFGSDSDIARRAVYGR